MIKLKNQLVKKYYLLALIINFIPLLFMIINSSNIKGEARYGFLIFGVWGIISALTYCVYLFIPKFKSNSEQFFGFILPSLILLLVTFKFYAFLILLVINVIINSIFIWHYRKNAFANKDG